MEPETEQITAIRVAGRDPLRRSIKVGRKTVATISVERVAELGLKVGMVWDDPLAQRVETAAAGEKVWRDALRTVGRRMIGTAELGQRLRGKGHAEGAVNGVLEKLTRKGLLDDVAYGRAVIRQVQLGKPAGRRLLSQKLMQKRLERDLIDRLLDEAEGGTDAVGDARGLAERKLETAAMRRVDAATRQRRLWGMLARRGFDAQTIRSALEGLEGLKDHEEFE